MKFKSCLIIITVLLLFIPGTLFAQQSDFYGTWTTKITEDNETIFVKFIISATRFIMSLELYEDNKLIDTENIEAAITNWAALNNIDNITRINYPNGFSITISSYGYETPIDIFISRDRRQITIPELNEDWDDIIAFTKQ